MSSSTQLTAKINSFPNPAEAEAKAFGNARYLVAQFPAADDYNETNHSYYNGRQVIPAPKADPELFRTRLYTHDLPTLKNKHYIRFTDSKTTDGADESVGRAIYTIMTPSEADNFESLLREQMGLDKSDES